MSEKKKKPSFLLFRSKDKDKNGDTCDGPKSPQVVPSQVFLRRDSRKPHKSNGQPKSRSSSVERARLSVGGIRDLVQCALCMDVLNNAKMLPCQHTFCLSCLTSYVGDLAVFSCPICKTKIQMLDSRYLINLPSNLYIDSLLQLVGKPEAAHIPYVEPPPSSHTSVDLFASSIRCSHCQTMCDHSDITNCQHCKMNFCKICWSQHLDDMQTQIGSILKQLESAYTKMKHKVENYKDRCERLEEIIAITTEEKINDIIDTKEKLLKEATDLQKSGDLSALALMTSLDEARAVATRVMTTKSDSKAADKVSTFINLHQNALQLLTDVSRWDTEHFVFDKENFCIELDAASPLEAESDEPLPIGAKENNPLESEDTLTLHYRSRNFIPHFVWRKTMRPCGIGVSPWNNNLYICGMDTHSVLVIERTQAKLVSNLTTENMLCPVHIAFMKSLGEIYVTDKWKHCVHVFSKDGQYLRSFGQKGSRIGMFRSPEGIATDNANHHIYVVDTGNDRVQVFNVEGTAIDQFGVVTKAQTTDKRSVWQHVERNVTELNTPTSVAVTNDRVIILDSGNRRVKVYNKHDKNKILEFGSLGQRKGQFRHPEVLTVDPLGFILVGDSGNSRVQVFKQSGQLVRVFGGYGTEPGKFSWISGIHVTKQMDIIISDSKNHCVNFV